MMDHKRIDGEPFILSEDKARGIRVVGWYEIGDNRLHYQTQQVIPDEFFQQTNEQDQSWSANEKRGHHMQKFASIPMQLRHQWFQEFGVSGLGQDPDVDKKILKRLNSNEFRKLRTGGGRLI